MFVISSLYVCLFVFCFSVVSLFIYVVFFSSPPFLSSAESPDATTTPDEENKSCLQCV